MKLRVVILLIAVVCGLLMPAAGRAEYNCRWTDPAFLAGDGLPHSYLGDLDGDGVLEMVIVPLAAPSSFQIIDARNGSLEHEFNLGTEIVYISVLNLDADSNLEVLVQGQTLMAMCEWTGTSAVSDPGSGSKAGDHVLHRAHPNPFNPRTVIPFTISSAGAVDLEIFDVEGRLVRRLVEQRLEPGQHEIPWDGKNDLGWELPSGQYFFSLTVDGRIVGTQRAIILK